MRLSSISTIILMLATCACSDTADKSRAPEKQALDPWEADSLAYHYWANPASPYRDEERYIGFLDSLLAVDSLPEALRERAELRRDIAMLNRRGTIAADFRYLGRDGRESRLHNLQSPLTLLVFYDPECPHCNDILRALAASKAINTAISQKELVVLAIYAEGKRDVWDKTCGHMPANWLVGYDLTGILDDEIYDLPAMPTPYLLDRDKRVILKDPTIKQLLRRISMP